MEVLQRELCEMNFEQFWSCVACEGCRLVVSQGVDALISRFMFACLDSLLRRRQHSRLRDSRSPTWGKLHSELKLDIFRTLTKWLLAGRTNYCQTQSVFFRLTLFPSVLHKSPDGIITEDFKCKCYFICRPFISTSNIYLIYLMTGEFCPVFIIELCFSSSFFFCIGTHTSFVSIDLYLEIPQWRWMLNYI